jgi:phage terminase large subunit-like protein
MAGRGFGKTLALSGWIIEQAMSHPDTHWAVVAPSYQQARDVLAEGPTGLLKVAAEGEVVSWNRSTGEIRLANGSRIHVMSGDEPDRLRGLNLAGAGVDELASFRYAEDAWRGALVPAVRIDPARIVVATTPRPTPLLRDLASRDDGSVIVTRGSTFDSREHLSHAALAELEARYEGTTLGRQELYGELLTDVQGALWRAEVIERTRVAAHNPPHWLKVIVGLDPAAGSEQGDQQGLAVVGLSSEDRNLYVIESEGHRVAPWDFLNHALDVALRYLKAEIMLEKAGADAWGDLLRQAQAARGTNIYAHSVHSPGKRVRAEPISGFFEQGKMHLVGSFPELESQLLTWTGTGREPSPDRLDALCIAAWPWVGQILGPSSSAGTAQSAYAKSPDAIDWRGHEAFRDVPEHGSVFANTPGRPGAAAHATEPYQYDMWGNPRRR